MRKAAKRLAGIATICAAVVGLSSGAALAAGSHVFNPELSLTGDCSQVAPDLTPDPGLCPMPPGVKGVDHPASSFTRARAVTADSYGNLYVANYGKDSAGGSEGHIDVFDSSGFFISTVAVQGPTQIAVDGDGYLYVIERPSAFIRLSRLTPTTYEPAAGEIAYSPTPVVLREQADFGGASAAAVAINPINDHLFLGLGNEVIEYGSATEGNPVIGDPIGKPILHAATGLPIAIDAERNRLYVSDDAVATAEGVVRVFELAAPHALLDTISGAGTPAPGGKFAGSLAVAADEASGNVFAYDGGELGSKVVYEFDEDDEYLASFGGEEIKDIGVIAKIWVDNGANSPNGALNSEGRTLFVPSHPSGTGHVFAYGPSAESAPKIEALSFAGVTREEAELRATINPGQLPTPYTLEYTTEEAFADHGFDGATVAGSGVIPAQKSGAPVSAAASGLQPGLTYRFRVRAENSEGSVEAEGRFATYPAAEPTSACANDGLRTGLSAALPDCRAYELVSPSDTNGRSPLGAVPGIAFPMNAASPQGEKVSFQVRGGVIPGYEGTGSLFGDPYLATRTAAGWGTAAVGPNGAEAKAIVPGSPSPDQGYTFWGTGGPEGSATIEGRAINNYVHYPDGHSELIGRGAIGSDPGAVGKLISEDGGHIIFQTFSDGPYAPIRLEEAAPPSGTWAVYDRTADGTTHVVSLLPGELTPAPGEDAKYLGASLDGEGIAFTIGKRLYLRQGNAQTYEIGENVTFAGLAEGGRRVFYLEDGDLKAFDVDAGLIDFTTSGDVTPVNVTAGGTVAYFVSPSVLSGAANPHGDSAQAGAENLYRSHEGAIEFVATVTKRDVEGVFLGVQQGEGLGLWTQAVGGEGNNSGQFGIDPSRTTPDGEVLLFESRAELSGYDPQGAAQIYRYDAGAGELQCLSCVASGAEASGGASLQSLSQSLTDLAPLNSYGLPRNLRADGRRAYFQSMDALVPEDGDGLQDVYQWEAQGVGSCSRPQGCISLISSGRSGREDYLYAVSASGEDVFIHTSDLLLPSEDPDETPSIYDARVGGGFAPPPARAGECLGEACQPAAVAPNDSTPSSSTYQGAGNVKSEGSKPRCPKGKVRRGKKQRCVVKKSRKHHNAKKRSGAKGRAHR